jgi:DNA-binding transcriptional regulator PaaX
VSLGEVFHLNKWLLLIYKIPREPTAGRVYVWRKLKHLGALALQDAVWILPATPRTQEHFQWLAAEIAELNGEATLFVSEFVFGNDSQHLIDQFEQPVKEAYQEILSALKRKNVDLAALSKQFQQIQALDYFQCKLGPQVRAKLLAAQRGK